jgi:hypothetical protein
VGPRPATQSSRPPGLDYRMRLPPSGSLCPSCAPIFGRRGPPLALGHTIIITISRTSGAQPCLASIVHSRRACSHPRDPSYRSMIYGMPGGNPERHRTQYPGPAQPAQPSPAQICICRFPPEGPWDSLSSGSLAFCADGPWQAKQHVTQCNADGVLQHPMPACFGRSGPELHACPYACFMASQLTTSSPVASTFRETFQS